MFKNGYPGITESVLDLIGNTACLKLSKVTKGLNSNVLLKLEYLNPSGSIKDRMGLRMIESAEEAGLIQPGVTTLTEASSGNTAQAVAMVAAVKGYKIVLRVPESTASPEKLKALSRFGAIVELMKYGEEAPEADRMAKDAGLHGATVEMPGRVKCLLEEKNTPDTYWLRQFSNPANWQAQAQIGRELLAQTGGKIDVFVASIGTGGTFLGVSSILKEALPHVKCVAVQPTGWEGFIDPLGPDTKYVPGVTGGILETIRDSGLADEICNLGTKEAVDMAYRLSREEGLNVGMSTGANVFVALEQAKRPGMDGKTVVTVAVDSGYRYIKSEIFIT